MNRRIKKYMKKKKGYLFWKKRTGGRTFAGAGKFLDFDL